MLMPEISLLDVALRILVAMLVGFVVGAQRASTDHPAGLRTHMLVALGACMVMITGMILHRQTMEVYGTGSDPARLGAQVISGVGFLGAGAILKEGFSVRGLTTAASLWAVACLGLTAGAGYFSVALLGGASSFLTLVAFDRIQTSIRKRKQQELDLEIECEQMGDILVAIEGLSNRFFANVNDMSFNRTQHNTYTIRIIVAFSGKHYEFSKAQFTQSLAGVSGIISMKNNNEES